MVYFEPAPPPCHSDGHLYPSRSIAARLTRFHLARLRTPALTLTRQRVGWPAGRSYFAAPPDCYRKDSRRYNVVFGTRFFCPPSEPFANFQLPATSPTSRASAMLDRSSRLLTGVRWPL